MRTKPPIGLWIVCPPRRVLGPGYIEELKDLGISTAAIMVETSNPELDVRWTPEQIGRACELCRAADIEVVLSVWPMPSREYLEELAPWLESVVPLGVAGVECDLEHLWAPSRLHGFTSLTEAAAYLLLRLHSLRDRHDVRLEVTTHPWHSESSPRALVAPHVDRLVEQAYSIRERPDGTLVAWDSRTLGPGHHQRWAIEDARLVPSIAAGHPNLSLGLAAWSQVWPDHAPREAMRLAYDAALECEPAEVRYWSSAFVLGSAANGYSATWLRG